MPDGDEETPTPETPPGPTPSEWAQMKLDNALLKANVDIDSPQGQMVARAWAGKEPDADEIAKDWELVKPQIAAEEVPLDRIEGEEGQAEERRILAASSTVEPDPTDKDPRPESMRVAREVLSPTDPYQRAGTHVDAMATALHMRIDAAAGGDTRVIPER